MSTDYPVHLYNFESDLLRFLSDMIASVDFGLGIGDSQEIYLGFNLYIAKHGHGHSVSCSTLFSNP